VDCVASVYTGKGIHMLCPSTQFKEGLGPDGKLSKTINIDYYVKITALVALRKDLIIKVPYRVSWNGEDGCLSENDKIDDQDLIEFSADGTLIDFQDISCLDTICNTPISWDITQKENKDDHISKLWTNHSGLSETMLDDINKVLPIIFEVRDGIKEKQSESNNVKQITFSNGKPLINDCLSLMDKIDQSLNDLILIYEKNPESKTQITSETLKQISELGLIWIELSKVLFSTSNHFDFMIYNTMFEKYFNLLKEMKNSITINDQYNLEFVKWQKSMISNTMREMVNQIPGMSRLRSILYLYPLTNNLSNIPFDESFCEKIERIQSIKIQSANVILLQSLEHLGETSKKDPSTENFFQALETHHNNFIIFIAKFETLIRKLQFETLIQYLKENICQLKYLQGQHIQSCIYMAYGTSNSRLLDRDYPSSVTDLQQNLNRISSQLSNHINNLITIITK
ncbi:hypothetical protein ROZALSC1DRAFT_23217, partial [Rozella allomycis CSF55]